MANKTKQQPSDVQSFKILSASSVAAIKAAQSAISTADKKRGSILKALRADNVDSSMLAKPEKGAEEHRARAEVKSAIFLGFTDAVRTVMTKDVKVLNVKQKTERKYWQQQIGSRLGDIVSALKRDEAKRKAAEDAANGEDADGEGDEGSAADAAMLDKLCKELSAWKVKLQKSQEVSKTQVDSITKGIDAAIAAASKR